MEEYNTALKKGTAMISESIELLKLWNEKLSFSEFKNIALTKGVLGKTTQKRLIDIISEVFAPRFLIDGQKPAKYLQQMLKIGIPQTNIRLILFLYTCRAQKLLYDFLRTVYWKKYFNGIYEITKTDVVRFIEDAIRMGKTKQSWSNSSIDRVSQTVLKVLSEFQFIEQTKKQNKKMVVFTLDPFITKYLTHEIHFNNLSDDSILTHPDWLLFGITEENVINELERAARDGTFIIQYSGELLRVSWKYASMKEFMNEQGR